MPLPLLVKGAIALGGAFGLYELFGSSSTPAPAGPRPPYTSDVPPPGGAILTWDKVDATLCLAFDNVGASDAAALLNDLAHRLYPDVPSWPPIAGDSESLRAAYVALGGRVSTFVNMVKNGEKICQGEPPAEPGGDEAEVVVDDYFTGKPGGFVDIKQGDNPTSVVAAAYGIPQSQTGAIRIVLACVATVGYNLVFVGHERDGDNYGRGKTDGAWYDVNWAFLPRNDDPRIAAVQGRKMTRWVGWKSGNLVPGGPDKFFPLWLPPIAQLEGGGVACAPLGTWNAARNPPAAVLAKIGWTLDDLKKVWLASGIAGPGAV
jgi:hypothetical protein